MDKPITVKNVPANRRPAFMHRMWSDAYLSVETRLFGYAAQCIRDPKDGEAAYKGGIWEFSEASNGCGWAWPKNVPEIVDLGCIGEMGTPVEALTRVAAGLGITIMAVNHELWDRYRKGQRKVSRELSDQYHRLMHVVYSLPDDEASKLAMWLD